MAHHFFEPRDGHGAFVANALHIGVVGCSAEGAALCYRTLCAEGAQWLSQAHAHPEISLHTPSLARYVACLERGDWQGVGELMLHSAQLLARAGAKLLICPDNTIHQAWPFVAPRSPLPWPHIAQVVAAEAEARGLRCVGILGTRWLVDGPVYPEALAVHGLRFERPTPRERDALNRIIMDELVPGVTKPESTATCLRIIEALRDRGCDAIVLGCTELPLVLGDHNSPLPTLDSTRLLARAALRLATQPIHPDTHARTP